MSGNQSGNLRICGSLFLLFFLTKLFSQEVLVTATSFNPNDLYEDELCFDISGIKQEGLLQGIFTPSMKYSPDANKGTFMSDFYYNISDNPKNLDSDYPNLIDYSGSEDYMFMFNTSGKANQKYFSYRVHGLKPGTNFRTEIEYCYVVKADNDCFASTADFKIGLNPQNTLNDALGATGFTKEIEPENCEIISVSGFDIKNENAIQPVGENGVGNVVFSHYTDSDCSVFGIKSIKIYGIPDIHISAVQGAEVCNGDIINLQTNTSITADYKWEVFKKGMSDWTSIGTQKEASFTASEIADYQFRLTIANNGTSFTSNTITVSSVACCENNGVSMSRKIIFLDNFGRAELRDRTGSTYWVWDYSDITTPKEIQKTTTTPFRWEISPAPLNSDFSATGTIEDGQYAIASYLTTNKKDGKYIGSQVGDASNITGTLSPPVPDNYVGRDHSGKKDGGLLLVDIRENSKDEVIYSKDIEGACADKDIFFECWIATFNTEEGVDIRAELTDKKTGTTTSIPSLSAESAENGGGNWERLAGSMHLEGDAFNFKIINNSNLGSIGNSLALDDIKVSICATPTIDIFYSLDSSATSIHFCENFINLFPTYPEKLLEYYDNAPFLIYQYTHTPNDISSWTNINNTPRENIALKNLNPATHDIFKTMENGDSVFFRVIAATEDIFSDHGNFEAPNYAKEHDPCKEYSVSSPIVAIKDCEPCRMPKFTGLALSHIKDTILCPNTFTEIRPIVSLNKQDSISYVFYKSGIDNISSSNRINATYDSITFEPLVVHYADTGTYTLDMWDRYHPNDQSCHVKHEIHIGGTTKPTYEFLNAKTACKGEEVSNIQLKFTGTPPFEFSLLTERTTSSGEGLSNYEELTSNSYRYSIDGSLDDEKYIYSLFSFNDKYCNQTNMLDYATLEILPSPEVTIKAPAIACENNKEIFLEVTPLPSSTNSGSFSTSAPKNAIDENQGIFYPSDAGHGKYDVSYTYTDKVTGCSNTAEATIEVLSAPNAEFDIPDVVCYNAAPILLEGHDINNSQKQSEKWEISDDALDISNGYFDPTNGEEKKSYTISYIYQNTEGCTDTASKDILIHNLPEPNVVDQSIFINNLGRLKPMIAYGEKNATFIWYNNAIEELKTDTKVDTSKYKATENKVGTFSYFVTQTKNGCTSKAARVQTSISECSTPAPKAQSITICQGAQSIPNLKAQGTGLGKLTWTDSKGTIIKENSDTYTPSISTDKAGTYIYKVYETNNTILCNSPSTTVTVKVQELPDVSVGLDKTEFCKGSEAIKFTPYPFSPDAKLEGEGTKLFSDHAEFIPATEDNSSKDFWIKYTYSETDNNTTCTGSDSLKVSVLHVDTVTPTHEIMFTTWGFVPEIQALNTKGEITWTDSLGRTIHNAQGLTSWQPSLPKEDGYYIPGIYKFSAIQTVKGCKSEATVSTITVDICPTEKPAGTGNHFCYDTDELPFITAEATVPGENSNLAWFSSKDSVVKGYEIGYGTALTSENTEPGEHSYFVSEFHEEKQCYGKAEEVVLTIFGPPEIQTILPQEELCYNDDIMNIEFIPDGGTLTGVGVVGTHAFDPSIAGKETNEYELYYAYTDDKGCSNIDTTTILVRYVAPPELESEFLVQDRLLPKPIPPLKGKGDDAGCIYWYTENQTYIDGSKCKDSYVSTINIEGVQTYFARQKVGACFSDYAETTLEITYCPAMPPITRDTVECADNKVPPVTAKIDFTPNGSFTPTGSETIYWYDQPNAPLTSYIEEGTSYTYQGPTPTKTKEFIYYARVYSPDLECLSPLREAKLTLIKPDIPAIINPDNICEGEAPQILKGEKETVKWYNSPALPEPAIGSGNYTAPDDASGTYVYYAVDTDPDYGCQSEIKEITYTIHPKPLKPIVDGNTGCEGGKDFFVTGTSQENIRWFNEEDKQQQSIKGNKLLLFEQYMHVGDNEYYAISISEFSCKSDTSLTIFHLKETPKKPFLQELPPAICLGDEPIIPIVKRGITEHPEVISHWYTNGDTLHRVHTGEELDIASETFTVGKFIVSVEDELLGCISERADTSIPVRNIPDPSIAMDTIVCQNSRELKTIEPKYLNQDEVRFSISNIENGLNYLSPCGATSYPCFNYKANNAGVDYISMEATNGYCTDSITQAYYVIPAPVVDFDVATNNGTGTATFTNATDQEEIFNIHSNKITYQFNYGKDETTLTDTFSFELPVTEFFNYGIYEATLYATNEYGCTSNTAKEFKMDITTALFVPNAFAPECNGRGVKGFLPKGHNLLNYELTIFDTWGNTVFQTNKIDPEKGVPTEAWNGNDFKGNPLKSDYYIWKIEAKFKNQKDWEGIENKNGKYKTTGSVFLIR